jgi:hypothetical protein
MHALVISVTVHDREAATQNLRENIVPRVSQTPGFVAGYWTAIGPGVGRAMIVFESEEAARGLEGELRASAGELVSFDSVDVGEVIAHA